MRQRWSKFRQLPFRDRALLLAALVMLPAVRVGLRLFGFRRLCRGLAWMTPSPNLAGENRSAGADLVRARASALCVRRAADHGAYRANCLDQSLALWWLLRLQGIGSEIRIGVRKDAQLEAHAWVEVISIVVNDRDDVGSSFAPFTGPIFSVSGQARLPRAREPAGDGP